ncbi:MAG: two-component regulator propeller domain-containing protein [Anaerolineae bacterium]
MKKRLILALVLWLSFALTGCGGGGADPAIDWVLSEARWQTYAGLPSDRIYALAVDADECLWAGTDSGVLRFDGAGWESIIADVNREVLDLALDDRGRVWLLDERDVQLYDQGKLSTFHDTSDVTRYIRLRAILVDTQGRVWIGGHWCHEPEGAPEEGVAMFESEQVRYFNADDGLPSTMIYDLAEDASGTIWAAGEMGIARFDGTAWESMTLPDQPVSQVIRTVAVDPSGRIWLGTRQLGLWIWNHEEWTQYGTDDGLAGDTVLAIAFDGAGRAWLGTSTGLSVFDGEVWTTYTTENGLPHNQVQALAIGEDGVWVSTYNGLGRLVFGGGAD